MEKNTILAIVLSTLVLLVSFVLQGFVFNPARKAPAADQTQSHITAVSTEPGVFQNPASPAAQETAETSPSIPAGYAELITPHTSISSQDELILQEYVTIDTDVITAVITNAGGDMVSWNWKDPRRSAGVNDASVELILSGNEQARAFSVAFGNYEAAGVTSLFHVNRITPYIVEFYRDFANPSAGTEGRFRLTKRYEFKPGEYMFELVITLDGGHSTPGFNFSGNAYTLSFGPQIGPSFEKLNNYYDYRQFHTFVNGKKRNAKPNDIIDTRPSWASISGKYFAFIAIPYLAQYNLRFSEKAEPGIAAASRISMMRPAANISKIEDTYRFYLGPKTQNILSHYNTGRNEFDIKDAHLVEIASSRGILSPLEAVLKWLLLMFYGIVRNYGIAIILLTLLIKILFFPLTKKGSEATLRMQALAPKIKELQEKYKDNPKKMNAEMQAFYQKEGYNPISGCLPMLLQLPIFIAMYSLFNNHFDLRGAGFIPGWIPDLSVPEYIWQFPGDFKMPFFGWTALRALPFIYVGSQLLYGKVTQMPGQQSNAQMKMMLYFMPIIFFFILYDVPSGLLIYWIFSNILTLVQQLIINKYVLKKRAQQAEAEPVIAPKKNKKNK